MLVSRWPLVALTAAVLVAASPERLSDPVGVYAVIDRVVLEPNAQNPERVQLWGVFALADGRSGDGYSPGERGYLYYRMNGDARVSRAEWADLASIAGTGEPVAFAGRYERLGRVRREGEPLASADPYPRSYVGVTRVTTAHYGTEITRALARVPAPMSPADGGTVPAGTVKLVTRNIADSSARYVFELEGPSGVIETSQPLRAGAGETSWTPRAALQGGVKYTWRVHTVGQDWKGTPAEAGFSARR